MFIEIRHLRSIQAIEQEGNLAQAAERLHLTASALSHQIKALETYFGTPLFLRSTRPLRLTAAGKILVELANRILPLVAATETELRMVAGGRAGRLHIAIECHACFEWLLPVIEAFRNQWPEVEVDIRLGLSFDPIPAVQKGEVDLVISSDPVDLPDLAFEPLFEYEALLVMHQSHPLAQRTHIEPADLAEHTLITYPVSRQRLDVFTRFLQPAGIEPAEVRQAELTAVILLLVASLRGVAALPDWVLRNAGEQPGLVTRPLGRNGMRGTLYGAIRRPEMDTPFMRDFIELARQYGARSQETPSRPQT